MPALSWNEIRQNAIQFSREWEGAKEERAEAQSFWNEFLKLFGIKRRSIAAFEQKVKSIERSNHRIDFFIPGTLLAEHKSAGESLDKAESQAFEYITDLFRAGREKEIPRYIVLCNFHTFALYDLEPDGQSELPLWRDKPYKRIEFSLSDLHSYVKHFAFLLGQKTHKFVEEDPANIEAAQIMADLHDEVYKVGYPRIDMERLLVRLLFCLFADDTGIFDASQFQLYIENKTKEDGIDLGLHLHGIFDTLNTPYEGRSKIMDEDLAAFPYINGELFSEPLKTVTFNRDMRNRLLAACSFDWSRISPAIFGSLFQGIMDTKERRQIGAHFTSERDILKVIKPLFLDELREEFEKLKSGKGTRRRAELLKFQEKLTKLKFLDPACGCGNFLVIAYRELRDLELEALKIIHDFERKGKELELGEVAKLSKVDVHQFYGIEILEWPTRIAETALWLTDHQMNMKLTLAAGNMFQRIPLKSSPHIHYGNALRMDWNTLLPAKACSYVLGNPPFVGYTYQNSEQKKDMGFVCANEKTSKTMDYVTAWYVLAAKYIQKRQIECAFVSTNSIAQGEQAAILWELLKGRLGINIHFAYRTFEWESEAKGKAHVHVVIIGFSNFSHTSSSLYESESLRGDFTQRQVDRINPYLVEGPDVYLHKRSAPLCNVPTMSKGSQPTDDGNFILTEEERRFLLSKEPLLAKYLRPYMGSEEFINGNHRWCIWLHGINPSEYRDIPEITQRINKVRVFRQNSKKKQTQEDANKAYEFTEIRQPLTNYVLVPSVSSERRRYVPIGYVKKKVVCSNLAFTLPSDSLYVFGVITSTMHMDWMRHVCGRLESRYRYSNSLVYNNFPWPESPTAAQQAKVEQCAQAVLDAREKYIKQGSNLADLYDPLTMPADLLKAHQALDTAVDKCYRSTKFNSERERVEYLFGLYEKLTSPLTVSEPVEKKRRKKQG